MSLTTASDVKKYLISAGLATGETNTIIGQLSGGVSCNVWKIADKKHTYVLKEALAKLNVKADWFSDVTRIHREHEVMELLFSILPPGTIPQVLHKDYNHHLYAMNWIEATGTWKDLLMNKHFDQAIAAQAGTLLRTIHNGSVQVTEEKKQRLISQEYFIQLRIDPFHRYLIDKCPLLTQPIEYLIHELTGSPACLVHGDFSPKNMLINKDGNLVIIDYEVAHWGNPVFDLSYCCGHLLLKGWHLDKMDDAASLVNVFLDTYNDDTGRLLPHLGLMLLARVDGKSPVNYITNEELKDRIRKLAIKWIHKAGDNTDALQEINTSYIQS